MFSFRAEINQNGFKEYTSLVAHHHPALDLCFFKIGNISTLLYLPTIDKIVYGLMDGSIVISPAIEFLVKKLFRRPIETDKSSMRFDSIDSFYFSVKRFVLY